MLRPLLVWGMKNKQTSSVKLIEDKLKYIAYNVIYLEALTQNDVLTKKSLSVQH